MISCISLDIHQRGVQLGERLAPTPLAGVRQMFGEALVDSSAPDPRCGFSGLFPPEEALGDESEHQCVSNEDQQRLCGRELAHP